MALSARSPVLMSAATTSPHNFFIICSFSPSNVSFHKLHPFRPSFKRLYATTSSSSRHNSYLQRPSEQRSAQEITLQLLEWHRVCDILAGFAGTERAKELLQISTFPATRSESEELLSKTSAGIEVLSLLGTALDFNGLQTRQVASSIDRMERGFEITGKDAVAIATLVQFSYSLQQDVKTVIQKQKNVINLVEPIFDMINTMVVHQEVFKEIWKVVDPDGIVKDNASPDLRKARLQVRTMELKLQQMLNKVLTENEADKFSIQEVRTVNGRLCVMVASENQRKFPGLLLQSVTDEVASYIEPLAAINLNDKLVEARASVIKAEYDALRSLTRKLLPYLDDVRLNSESVIEIDVVMARAKYSLSFGGTRPMFTSREKAQIETSYADQQDGVDSTHSLSNMNSNKEIILQLRETYHPLLLYQYQEYLRKLKGNLKEQVADGRHRPVPIDLFLTTNTKVVIISGPNTGGKTAAMKTVGLTALMAKAGLYVLSADPAYIPWFDAVYADIGDEQSLTQSLSTFSGHLQRITAIKAECSASSLVLLDEVGAGTNPAEGAALGMAILESFTEKETGGSFLTFATTHHSELKILKYRDNRFENASVEFDEEHLRPTYRLLFGIPGRSNALNIAQRLGVSNKIIATARRFYGKTNAEINQSIMQLEKAKQEFEHLLPELEHYLDESKILYRRLAEAKTSLAEFGGLLNISATQQLLETARAARSSLSAIIREKQKKASSSESFSFDNTTSQAVNTSQAATMQDVKDPPQIGEIVYIPRLGRKAKILAISMPKNEITLQSGDLQIKLNQKEIQF